MQDKSKTKKQLIQELVKLRQNLLEIKAQNTNCKHVDNRLAGKEKHPIELISKVQNITERKETEEKLRKSQQKLEELINSIDSIVWEADVKTFQFTFVSKQAEEILGYPVEAWVKEKGFWENHIHPDDREWTFDFCLESLKSKKRYSFEYRMIAADGRIVWLKDIVNVIFKNNQPVKLRGIMVDITRHKSMENEILKSHKLESLGILAGGIAHDFNNILTGILGNISLAKTNIDIENETYKMLFNAETACMRAKSLTNELRTFSKGGKPIKEKISIVNLLQESTDFALSGSTIKPLFFFQDNLWSINADKSQMSQVIHNIIINADEASHNKGKTIKVCVENITINPESALPLKKGKYLKISVIDQGEGIPGKNLLKVFDPYFTTKKMGSGLGLAICYSIIKNHDGFITAESEPGVGTTFIIYLPAFTKIIHEKKHVEQKPLIGSGKILIMDDEKYVRDVLCKMLMKAGYDVDIAKNGGEALEIYKKAKESKEPFDAVILDLTVKGGMGGEKTIKKLLEINPDVKAIVSSGYYDNPIMANYKKFGFRGILNKPYKSHELANVIQNILKD